MNRWIPLPGRGGALRSDQGTVGLYLLPVNVKETIPPPEHPPHTIISVPVHTAVWRARALRAFVLLTARQRSCTALYRAPLMKNEKGRFR